MKVSRGLRLSVRVLATNRMRTALSILGLVVGVAAVMVMAAIGQGAEHRILAQVRALGTDLAIVSAAPAPRVAGRARQEDVFTILRPADADAILEWTNRAVRVAPAAVRSMTVHAGGLSTSTTITGITPDGLSMRGIDLRAGRHYDEFEDLQRRRVAILGSGVAHTLFGSADPVGRVIRIGAVPFDVIGVARARGADVGGGDQDHIVFIPLETALRRVFNISWVHHIYVQGRSIDELPALETDVRRALLERHRVRPGTREPFNIVNQATLLETEREARRTLRLLTAGTGALTLVLGAVGILAVMLMSVRERVREIGLRRALGARQHDIHLQFLLETALLAAAGGLLGVITGFLAAALLAWLGPWSLVLPWRAALLGLAAALSVGFLVGVVPARRAARLQPASALRST